MKRVDKGEITLVVLDSHKYPLVGAAEDEDEENEEPEDEEAAEGEEKKVAAEPEYYKEEFLLKQIMNTVFFVLCMICNGLAASIVGTSLSSISAESANKIQPAGWAFSIWGLIYTLLAIFTVWQVLPEPWVQLPESGFSRNNDLIFNKIGWLYVINMALNCVWFFVFTQNTTVCFWIALVLIAGMLVTQLMMLKASLDGKLCWVELVGLRIGMSIYTGWVNAATILGTVIALKSSGLDDDVLPPGLQESRMSCVICWVALGIYIASTIWQRNPLFACVFVYVLTAIRDQNKAFTDVRDHTLVIAILCACFVFMYTLVLIKEKTTNYPNEGKGLFY